MFQKFKEKICNNNNKKIKANCYHNRTRYKPKTLTPLKELLSKFKK